MPVFFVGSVKAQADTIISYMRYKYPGNTKEIDTVHDVSRADFIRVVTQPAGKPGRNDKTFFSVNDFYLNGSPKLVGSLTRGTIYSSLNGPCVEYFANGHKKMIANYLWGTLNGDMISYYPNGKLYMTGVYNDGKLKIQQCADSTVAITAENGLGTWKDFSEDFKILIGEGPIDGGMRNGIWKSVVSDTVNSELTYKNNVLISGVSHSRNGRSYNFTEIDRIIEVKGGFTGFADFVTSHKKYPKSALSKHIEGEVKVSFILEKTGTTRDMHVISNTDKDLNEEAIRLLKFIAEWQPAKHYGVPYTTEVTVSIFFWLKKDSDSGRPELAFSQKRVDIVN